MVKGGQHKALANIMRKMAIDGAKERMVREVARTILIAYKVPSKDFVNEVAVVQNFIQRQIRYQFDKEEQFEFPARSLVDFYEGKSGIDCDCQAILLSSLMVSLGWRDVWIVLVDAQFNGILSHACVAVKLPKAIPPYGRKLINVETTTPKPLGWMPKPGYTKYVMIKIGGMSQ
jgi:hypothetical protein